MKFSMAVIAAALLIAVPAFGQAPASGAQAQPSTNQKPSTPAPAAQPSADAAPAAPATVKVDPAKDAAIRHLMDVTESSKLGDTIQGAISSQVESVMGHAIAPEQMQKFMDTFNQKFDASAPASAVTDAMVPIYSQHFSMEEIQGITKFYESPIGQRLVKEMPSLVQETHTVGVEMDQKAAIDTLRAMSTDYPQLKQMLPPDPNQPSEAPAPAAGAAPAAAPPSGSTDAPATTPAPAPAK